MIRSTQRINSASGLSLSRARPKKLPRRDRTSGYNKPTKACPPSRSTPTSVESTFSPSQTERRPYKDLKARAIPFDLDGVTVYVACIDDLIAMKRAAGRPKDLAHIAELETIRRLMAEERDS